MSEAKMIHTLIPSIYLKKGKAVTGFGSEDLFEESDPKKLAMRYADNGADAILIYDFSTCDSEHDAAIDLMREICAVVKLPIWTAGSIHRVEDVKKILYAGCAKAVLNGSKESNIALIEEVSKRFGKDKIAVLYEDLAAANAYARFNEEYVSYVLLRTDEAVNAAEFSTPVAIRACGEIAKALSDKCAGAVYGDAVSELNANLTSMKITFREAGIPMNLLESAVPWSEFKKNEAGLVPCIVQDVATDEVLMMAWMNEESYTRTLNTGRMTYYSRSRSELWLKGETSGHYQYVKELKIDCDRDTILAKVEQVGAACHTGNRSCFYTTLADRGEKETNPYRVFENVMNVILDRKANPKEGSYTNYLFDKGIDKILKKVGEECTEIIIAAKNPNPEEIKYEIADFLYHVMVLMAERGVSWEEITDELARR